MRLGAPILTPVDDPDGWIAALGRYGYSAAYCPLDDVDDMDAVRAYAAAAEKAGVVIAEAGAFGNNPISPDEAVRKKGIETCGRKLALADRIGARCCVNVTGSRGERYSGPHEDNLTPETFDRIVASVREIIDAVKPTRTYYAVETMPFIYPDSPESYLQLLKAIDRERFAVHLDPVNLTSSPQRYYNSGVLLRECFEKLGPYIRSCHAKDIALIDRLTVHMDEVPPGLGGLDYRTFLQELNRLDPDTPLMLEHLPSEEEYALGAEYIRSVARDAGVVIR